MAEKIIVLQCVHCKENFERRATEHKRNLKKGRLTFCCNGCASCYRQANIPKEVKKERGIKLQKYCKDNNIIPCKPKDEFTPYRVFLKNVRTRNTEDGIYKTEIDEKYLKELWDSQNGICPYTGWKMIKKKSSSDRIPLTIDRASLDRIDSSKGYIKGNLQFICWIAQTAKSTHSGEDLIKFCKAVAEKHKE